ncbi:hypothetical protein Scep_020030 [Stephania cephalantha]|uniref:B-like cyclin n=1 Tax=Stephania cephalantha TaxID=152367 RepID=A0AAP0NQF4_9MAGN
MSDSDENNPNVLGPSYVQGASTAARDVVSRADHRRKVLGNIDQNVMRVQPKKRGLSGKWSAQSLVKRQLHLEETKESISAVSNVNDPEMECQTTSSFSGSVFEMKVEPIEDVDQMEIEVQDMMSELVIDIDREDLNNPLAVADYIEDILSYYREAENSTCVPPNYMMQQHDINEKMRALLIDWLIEVHYSFELMDETLFLMVNLIDRFLALKIVMRTELQLIGLTALLLASKYGDVRVPLVDHIILMSKSLYTRKQVIDMELMMINALQFNLFAPTMFVFIKRFIKAVQRDKKFELLSLFFIELCLVEYEMLEFRPSLLAAAAVYTAQCTLDRVKNWSKTSEWHSHYSEEQLLVCSSLMVNFHQKAKSGGLTAVYRKYSMLEFGHVARCEPAQFLLENNA